MNEEKSVYLLMTLSVRICSAEEVEQTKDLLISGLEKFAQIDQMRALDFRFCFLENAHCPSFPLDYHLHFHCVVKLRGRRPSCKVVQDCWRQACGLDYDPVVDVRKLSGFVANAYRW